MVHRCVAVEIIRRDHMHGISDRDRTDRLRGVSRPEVDRAPTPWEPDEGWEILQVICKASPMIATQ
jgi:hypothetical protein